MKYLVDPWVCSYAKRHSQKIAKIKMTGAVGLCEQLLWRPGSLANMVNIMISVWESLVRVTKARERFIFLADSLTGGRLTG
jgi:hypothetical protein